MPERASALAIIAGGGIEMSDVDLVGFPAQLGRYSCVPGIGLNLSIRNDIPAGAVAAASTIIDVQIIFVEVAAIAAVPWKTRPEFSTVSSENKFVALVDVVCVSRCCTVNATLVRRVAVFARSTILTVSVTPLKFVQWKDVATPVFALPPLSLTPETR